MAWRGEKFSEGRLRLWCAFASAQHDARLLDLLRRYDAVPRGAPTDTGAVRHVLAAAAARQRARLGSSLVRSWDMSSGAAAAPTAGGTLVIAFAGADAALGGGINGGVPSHEFVRACRKAGVRRAIFVRDVLRAWYLRGVGGEHGGSRFEDVMAMLREEIATARPNRLVTIGSSMGGYAAVRAALALNADAALAFAPQVAIDPGTRAERGLPSAPFDGLLNGLKAFGEVEGFPLESLDELVLQMAGAPSPRATDGRAPTAIEVHCGDADPGDVAEARTLAAAVESVSQSREGGVGVSCRVKVHQARDHNLVVEMRDSGELHELLCALVAADDAQDIAGAAPEIPSDFEGFANCPDF